MSAGSAGVNPGSSKRLVAPRKRHDAQLQEHYDGVEKGPRGDADRQAYKDAIRILKGF